MGTSQQTPVTTDHANEARLPSLDSLRGIASFAVLLSHCWLMTPPDFQNAHRSFLHAVTSISNLAMYSLSKLHEGGRSSVILFFVLSGFVLTQSLRNANPGYWGYAVKRFFRIYPLFFVVILISYGLHSIIGVRNINITDWLLGHAMPDLSWTTLLKHLAMLGTIGNNKLDGVIWTLVHEMRISLVFPFIYFFTKNYNWRGLALFAFFSMFCNYVMYTQTNNVFRGFEVATLAYSFLDSCSFTFYFALGSLLAVNKQHILNLFGACPTWGRYVVATASLYLLIKTDNTNLKIIAAASDYLRGLGAGGIIVCALGLPGLNSLLNHSMLTWLGRISYGLYLVHMPIMYTVTQTFGSSWSVLSASIAVILLSLLVADGLFRCVERPSILLGKRFSARLQGRPFVSDHNSANSPCPKCRKLFRSICDKMGCSLFFR